MGAGLGEMTRGKVWYTHLRTGWTVFLLRGDSGPMNDTQSFYTIQGGGQIIRAILSGRGSSH